jgi:hypothetical protein
VSEEIRTLIRQIASENLDWGAPKIHGELLKLGFEVSERTVGISDGCGRAAAILPSAGSRSLPTIEKRSSPLTSSPYRR